MNLKNWRRSWKMSLIWITMMMLSLVYPLMMPKAAQGVVYFEQTQAASKKLAIGFNHSLAVMADGSVYSSGDNTYGQLGDGTNAQRSTPVIVPGLSNVIAVAAGHAHSMALTADGKVYTWGDNSFGQLGDGTNTQRSTPVIVPGLSNVKAIAAGEYHSLALVGDTVYAWGNNLYGQVGDGTSQHSTTPVQVLGYIKAIAAGSSYSMALNYNGIVYAWGNNTYGQLGNGTNTHSSTPVQISALGQTFAIACADSHALAITFDGNVYAWGDNSRGNLGDGTTVQHNTPVQVSGLSNARAISAGGQQSLALTADGAVYNWGWICASQPDGEAPFRQQTTPLQVSGFSDVIAIAQGAGQALVLTKNGSVYGWGVNDFGQLGDGTNTVYVQPPVLTGFNLAGKLSGLTVSQGTLTPAFDTNKTNYAVNVPEDVTSLDITASMTLPADQYDLTIDGQLQVSGSPKTINMSGSSKAVPVSVIEKSTGITRAYTVNITRGTITQYSVNIAQLSGGTITADQTSAAAGNTITLTITPNAGNQLKAATLKYNDGTGDTAIIGSSFIMPAAPVTVYAVFEPIPAVTYAVSIFKSDGGTITADKTSAPAGDTVTLTITPDSGYQLKAGTLKYWDGTAETVITANSFIMPAVPVLVYAEFEPIPADECFIATAAYGSKFQPAVVLLRHFRDQYLLTNTLGKAFVKFYYQYSPPIAAVIATNQCLKMLVRVLLTPVVAIVYIMYHPTLLIIVFVLFVVFFAYRAKLRRRYV